jgi:Phosphoesterase family/FG-GAP-like repeat
MLSIDRPDIRDHLCGTTNSFCAITGQSHAPFAHIIVVMEENHSFAEIVGNAQAPYINSLANAGALLTNYHAITHPSQPNYFAIYAGSTFGVTDDGIYSEPDPTLATVLQGAGQSFIGYVESGSPRKHNPWESFPEGMTVERDFTTFPTDSTQLPKVAFVIPNLNNDMHDGTIGQADQWLKTNIDAYAQWAVTHNSLLIVVWDEDDGSESNRVPAIVYGAHVVPGFYGDAYTHYDVLRTLLNASGRGLSAPNNAAQASGLGNGIFSVSSDTHDFNGDGKSDIAWRNTNGDTALWLMTVNGSGGAQILSSADYGLVPTGWTIVGQRDFNGDGKADLLWSNTNGDTSIWLMNGTQVSTTIDIGFVGNGWSIVDTGDFNGDGFGDILWRNVNGDTSIWLMTGNATQVQVVSAIDFGGVPTSWSVARTGDFNGDGKADILWHNTNGDTSIWLMTGTATQVQVLSATDLGVVPTSWTIAGTGDFNGDGKSDILWHNSNGDTSIWLMTGTGSQVQVSSTIDLGLVPTSWSVSVTGDFNADGKSDILWRNTNGDTSIWFMTPNGTQMQVLSVSDLGAVPPSWVVQNAGAE